MKNYKENYDYYNVEKVDSIKQLLESAAADAGDKIAFTLEFQMESGATACSYQLIDQSNMQVVSSRTSFINY